MTHPTSQPNVTPESEAHCRDAFNAVRRYLHNPQVATSDVKALVDEFGREFPGSPLLRKLRMKYFFHRVLNGHRFRKVQPVEVGMQYMGARADAAFRPDSSDVLLISHEMSLTGAPRALLTLAIELKSKGFRPVMFTIRGGGMIAEAESHGIPVVANLQQVLKSTVFTQSEPSMLVRFMRSFPVIVYNTLETMISLSLVDVPGARRIGWIHESEGAYRDYDGNRDLDRLIARFDDIFIVGDFARSHALKRSPLAAGFRNLYYGVEALPPGIAAGSERFDDGRVHLLIAGSVGKRKGHHVLLQALAMLDRETLEAVHIHIAGDSLKPRLTRSLVKAGKGSVTYEGTMSHDALLKLFGRVDALLCPSLDDPMPIVCTEAFQLGVPVLVSDHTGTASFIRDGENGYLTTAGDPRSLADGIKRIVADRSRLRDIGAAAANIYADNFSMEEFGRRVNEIFGVK